MIYVVSVILYHVLWNLSIPDEQKICYFLYFCTIKKINVFWRYKVKSYNYLYDCTKKFDIILRKKVLTFLENEYNIINDKFKLVVVYIYHVNFKKGNDEYEVKKIHRTVNGCFIGCRCYAFN